MYLVIIDLYVKWLSRCTSRYNKGQLPHNNWPLTQRRSLRVQRLSLTTERHQRQVRCM